MHPMAKRMPVAAGGGWAAPDPVLDLAAVADGIGGVTLTWTQAFGATGYDIQRSLTNGNFASIETDQTGATYYDSSGDPNTLYYYRIIAKRGQVPSLPSNVASATTGSAFIGVLDSYTTDLAVVWSVRKRLLTSYTGPLIRVRRDADNTELDIGYTASGLLDQAALEAFCVGGTGSGYIRTIYDQSGNGINIGQATAANQPLLVQSSVMNADGMDFNGTTTYIDTASLAYSNFMAADKFHALFAMTASRNGNSRLFSFNSDSVGAWCLYTEATVYWDSPYPVARINYDPASYYDLAHTMSFEAEADGAMRIRRNGTVEHSGSGTVVLSGTSVMHIGSLNDTTSQFKGRMTDIVFWKSAASVDCAAREAALMA